MIDRFFEDFDGIPLTVGISGGYVVSVEFGSGEVTPKPGTASLELWERARSQLLEYTAGARRMFDLPIKYGGTQFSRLVWEGLLAIPYGQTRTYGELAKLIGRPGAARAVGMACHNNPIAVIIPCHRVIGSTGSLTGFAGGLEVKERLLRLEGAIK